MNITLSGTQTVDDLVVEDLDRVLVKNQTTASDNGIYVVSTTSAWSRASDFIGFQNAETDICIPVDRGTMNEATLWRVTNPGTIEIGVSSLTFESAEPSGVMFRESRLGAVTRTAHEKMRDFVSVRDFGGNDDRAKIQAAIDSGAKSIYFPAGTYRISGRPIDLPPGGQGVLHLFGAGLAETVLEGSGSFDSIFRIGSPGELTTFGTIEDMKITNEGDVKYGIQCTQVDHFTFRRIWCEGFVKAGISIVYGWCNDVIDSEFSGNAGHGVQLNTESAEYTETGRNGNNNAVNIRNCKIHSNEKHGIYARGGYGLWIDGCTIEQNTAGGIFLANFEGFSISSYFERNASTGYKFLEPPRNIKADIILCGAGIDTRMSPDFSCKGGMISSCPVSSTALGNDVAYSTVFVYDAGAVDCSIRNCVLNSETRPPFAFIAWEYDPLYRGYGWTVESCSGFTKLIDEMNVAAQTNSVSAQTRILAPRSDLRRIAQRRNYANLDFNTWPKLRSGTASTYWRSQHARLHFWNGLPIWSINSTAAGESHTYGMRLSAKDYPDLIGKLMWYGIWKFAPGGATAYAQPYCSKQEFKQSPHPLNEWIFEAVSFIWPRSGYVECGICKAGEGPGDIYFTAPMLMEVGTPMDEALQTIPARPYTWRGGSAPTRGRWLVGDTVLDSAPAAGRTPGWVCTTAGTPGTWRAMANLDN